MTGHSTERLRASLLARIHIRYATRQLQLRVGPLEFPFTCVADPDRVLDDAAAAEQKGALENRAPSVPYWAELWDSAMGLSQWIIEQYPSLCARLTDPRKRAPSSPPRMDVLDLGCGMGLSGVTAAAMGARVTFADLEPLPLLFARVNSLPWSASVEFRQVDWRSDHLNQSFHLILGADILYEAGQWEFLDRFWQSHLDRGGMIALGEPGRQTGEKFIRWIAARGWSLNESIQWAGPERKKIRILQLRRD